MYVEIYDMKTQKWSILKTSGDAPYSWNWKEYVTKAAKGHTSTLVNDNTIMLLGGFNRYSIHELVLVNDGGNGNGNANGIYGRWLSRYMKDLIIANHSANIWKTKVVVFGGEY